MRAILARLPLALLAAAGLLATAVAQGQDTRRIIHSPWLALRIEQDGAEASLQYTSELATVAHLRRAPFTLVLPVRGADDVYWLAARGDEGIFAEADVDNRRNRADRAEHPPYFAAGTGMADTAASSGLLMLNARGHHHLAGLRLGPDPDRHVFHVSAVMSRDAAGRRMTIPVEQLDGPLHFVIRYDEDRDEVMRHGEYEFITLRFDHRGGR